jgi:hypothetical protein
LISHAPSENLYADPFELDWPDAHRLFLPSIVSSEYYSPAPAIQTPSFYSNPGGGLSGLFFGNLLNQNNNRNHQQQQAPTTMMMTGENSWIQPFNSRLTPEELSKEQREAAANYAVPFTGLW